MRSGVSFLGFLRKTVCRFLLHYIQCMDVMSLQIYISMGESLVEYTSERYDEFKFRFNSIKHSSSPTPFTYMMA